LYDTNLCSRAQVRGGPERRRKKKGGASARSGGGEGKKKGEKKGVIFSLLPYFPTQIEKRRRERGKACNDVRFVERGGW